MRPSKKHHMSILFLVFVILFVIWFFFLRGGRMMEGFADSTIQILTQPGSPCDDGCISAGYGSYDVKAQKCIGEAKKAVAKAADATAKAANATTDANNAIAKAVTATTAIV